MVKKLLIFHLRFISGELFAVLSSNTFNEGAEGTKAAFC